MPGLAAAQGAAGEDTDGDDADVRRRGMQDQPLLVRRGGARRQRTDGAGVEQVVGRLRGGERARVQDAAQSRRIAEGGDAEPARLALVAQPLERRDRLGEDGLRRKGRRLPRQRDRVVQLEQVDAVPAEPAQARLQRGGDRLADGGALLSHDATLVPTVTSARNARSARPRLRSDAPSP
jgi:hypothetical protein